MTARRLSAVQLSGRLEQHAGNPLPALSPSDVDALTAIVRLSVLDVHQYERNPRVRANENYEGIREAIRANGMQSMIAVCREPTTGHYITARGGGTRLAALHELASERDGNGQPSSDALRFRQIEFQEVRYPGEASLLAAHLSENIQRADMCFWDTAQGLMQLRGQIEEDAGRPLSGREFQDELTRRGLSTKETSLQLYQFTIQSLAGLPLPVREALTRDDVRNVLRPHHSLMLELWLKHPGCTEDEFRAAYAQDVAMWGDSAFTAAALALHVQKGLAHRMGYGVEVLGAMLAALKLDRKTSLDALRRSPAPGGAVDELGGAHGAAAAGQTPPPSSPPLAQPHPASSKDPGDRVRVMTGLTPLQSSPRVDAPVAAATAPPFQALARAGRLEDLLRPAPGMPHGFFMEVAPTYQPLRTGEAVRAWWLLAHLAGQLRDDIDSLLESTAADGTPRLPDTGKHGFRQAISDERLWLDAVNTRLGGRPHYDAQFVLAVLTDPNDPLSAPTWQALRFMCDEGPEVGA